MIILIGGEKGGTGKTTLVTNLAAKCKLNKKDIIVIDTDKQGSASSWAATRELKEIKPEIPTVQIFGNTVHTQIMDLGKRYDDVIIDAGGRDSVELRSAMTIASKIYIPIQPSQFDIWTLAHMNNLVETARCVNSSIKAFIVINRASTNPSLREIEEANEILKEFDNLELSKNILKDRVSFRKAARTGESIYELAKLDEKACSEVNNLFNEVFNDAT